MHGAICDPGAFSLAILTWTVKFYPVHKAVLREREDEELGAQVLISLGRAVEGTRHSLQPGGRWQNASRLGNEDDRYYRLLFKLK